MVIEKRFHSQVKVEWFPISAGRVNGQESPPSAGTITTKCNTERFVVAIPF
jgi:hypothetical protein